MSGLFLIATKYWFGETNRSLLELTLLLSFSIHMANRCQTAPMGRFLDCVGAKGPEVDYRLRQVELDETMSCTRLSKTAKMPR